LYGSINYIKSKNVGVSDPAVILLICVGISDETLDRQDIV